MEPTFAEPLPANCWFLKGEGNAHAVFQQGNPQGDLGGIVLRVRKLQGTVDAVAGQSLMEQRIWQHFVRRTGSNLDAAWTSFVQAALLPGCLLPEVTCPLPESVRRALLSILQQHGRKPCPHALAEVGTIMHDATMLPISTLQGWKSSGPKVCLELKPKSGFLPTSAAISPEHDIKRHIPRLQLLQQLRLSKGEIEQADATHYNPLDLFSGNATRMQQAVEAMLERPARNLRVFSDGKRIANGEVQSFLSKWLQLPPLAAVRAASHLISKPLHQSGLLLPLLRLQQLDCHDIEGIGPLYLHLNKQSQSQSDPTQTHSNLQNLHSSLSSAISDPQHLRLPSAFHRPGAANIQQCSAAAASDPTTPSAPLSFMSTMPLCPSAPSLVKADQLSEETAPAFSACKPSTTAVHQVARQEQEGKSKDLVQRGPQLTTDQLLQLPAAEAHSALRDYLIAATAKDCSLMLCLQRLTPTDSATAHILDKSAINFGMPPEDAPCARPDAVRRPDLRIDHDRTKTDVADMLHVDVSQASGLCYGEACADISDTAAHAEPHSIGGSRNSKQGNADKASGPGDSRLKDYPQAGRMNSSSAAAGGEAIHDGLRQSVLTATPVGIQGFLQADDGSRIGFALVVVDLDRKASAKIPKHYALDLEVMQQAFSGLSHPHE
ncbi:hypothetical protein WJX74_000849 [Apatococcus lobatus]|uniref:inositol-pentakisphosphate 2-kinase n=1 Tax=Apatococcus lobatus TaxID=904363 RepID=A0AAW1RPD5_9CHLO